MDSVNEEKNLGAAVEDRETVQGWQPREWKLSSPMVNDMIGTAPSRGTMPIYGIDVPVMGDSEMTHYAGVQVCGNLERAEQIIREHNAHHALVTLARTIYNDGYLHPGAEIVDMAAAALALVDKPADESAKRLGWTREWPTAKDSFHWMRWIDGRYRDLPVHVNGIQVICLFDHSYQQRGNIEGLVEFLGPISPSDFEQLIRLRNAAHTAVDAIEFALTTPGLIRGRDLLKVNAAALREALATEEK